MCGIQPSIIRMCKQCFTCLQACCSNNRLLLYVWFFQAIAFLTVYNAQVKTKE